MFTMPAITFGIPEALWLAALAPLAGVLGFWLWRRRLEDTRAWAAPALWSRLRLRVSRSAMVISAVALAIAVLGVTLSIARPRWGSTEQKVERQGVDIVFVLDSSLSMEARDVAPSRMGIAKGLVRRLVTALPGHRVALVQAEGERIVLAPLTVDAAVIDLVLDTVFSGSLPNPGTRLVPALRDSLDLFPPESERHRVVVLLSDGEDHGGGWDELQDSIDAGGIVVHALGVGTPKGAPIPLPEGQGPEYKQDENGQIVVTKLNERALRRLAEESGGLYLTIDRASTDPTPIVAAIEEMEKRTFEGEVLNLQAERFQWPLAAAALALVLHLLSTPFSSERSYGHLDSGRHSQ